jgi:hypothetical protein
VCIFIDHFKSGYGDLLFIWAAKEEEEEEEEATCWRVVCVCVVVVGIFPPTDCHPSKTHTSTLRSTRKTFRKPIEKTRPIQFDY